jgi:DNA (cytosine-5)-methyltransferase 1
MRYLSICSGIEAASVAWHPLGWEPVGFAEIEKFPSAVLAHHWPDVPNLGDMTKFHDWPNTLRPDLIVGGTPCQAFSVAGLRKGLADPRGNLTLTFLALVAQHRPAWVVWENVPGVLSDKTGAFGAFLSGLAELGYGWAFRVLDAQHFGVAQRRRRVFVVASAGGWGRAAAVLFERESLCGHPPPRREAGKGLAPAIAGCLGGSGQSGGFRTTDLDGTGAFIPEVAGCLQERDSKGCDSDTKPGHLIPVATPTSNVIGCLNSSGGHAVPGNTVQDAAAHQLIPMAFRCEASEQHAWIPCPCCDEYWCNIHRQHACDCPCPEIDEWETDPYLDPLQGATHTLRGEGFDASEDGTGRGTPLVPVAFQPRIGRNGRGYSEDVVPALNGADAGATSDMRPCVAFAQNQRDEVREMEIAGALAAEPGMKQQTFIDSTAVRRLTPTECERLQGFPDGHTLIPWRGKPADQCPDGSRYKALGNSMAVPVMRWIGQRIAAVEQLSNTHP